MMKAFAAASVFLHVAAETQNNEYLRHTQESIDAIGMRSLNRIYGGEPVASAAEYPFFLSLMDGDSRVCGATLIAPKIALTAAHCVSSEEPDYDFYDTCTDIPGWTDEVYGDSCIEYPYFDSPGCPGFGDDLGVDGNYTANDACCYCGGGTECSNLEGWVDIEGEDCTWYMMFDSPGCPLYGDTYPNEDGITANDACCYCQAEVADDDDDYEEPDFTFYDNCTDIPDWLHAEYFASCIDYPYVDDEGCPFFGDDLGVDGNYTANDACCYCGGGTECSNLEGWVDIEDDDCTWYIEYDSPGCPLYGGMYPNEDGITANDACCYCQAVAEVADDGDEDDDHYEQNFEFYDDCTDIPDWLHAEYSISCFEYSLVEYPGCPLYGDDLGVDGNSIANDACCYCGGGTECSNLEDWVDIGGDDCTWYVEFDFPGCFIFGDYFFNSNGISANDACCYCQAEVDEPSYAFYNNCTDIPDWLHATFFVSCIDFPYGDTRGCPLYGDDLGIDGSSTANDACCYCNGGMECSNLEGWVDSGNFSCTWYIGNDSPGCPLYGDMYPNEDGITANDACCYCQVEADDEFVEPDFTFYDNCTDIPDWIDEVYGNSCVDYPYGDSPGCPLYGNLLGIDGNNTANDACCYCGGGTECSNLEGWVDSFNFSCTEYMVFDSPGCPLYGDMYPNEDGITANDACCYCQAVAEVADDDDDDDNEDPDFAFYDNCTDIPDWLHAEYFVSCIDYPYGDYEGCPFFGDDLGTDGNNTANDACCYCGGGTECSNLEGWVDSFNFSCTEYIEYDSPGCPLYGDMYPNEDGITANDACCYCQAIAEVVDDDYDDDEYEGTTYAFYDDCTDIPDWMHADYFITCIDYPYGGETGCPLYGDDLGVDGNYTANDACCYCGGGMECSNLEGWVDSGNDTCSWYIEYDSPGCPLYGDIYPDADGISANDACCYCQAEAYDGISNDVDFGDDYSVIFGVTQFPVDLKSSFERIRVVDIVVHPFYDKFIDLDHDFAVLHLERESNASAITLDNGFKHEAGTNMRAIGFGEADDDYGVIFREVDLAYVTNDQCKTAFPIDGTFVTESMMCAWRREKSICFGDSGGPLLITNSSNGTVQVGISSWVYECGSEFFPSGFARVGYAFDWIMDQVDNVVMTESPTTSPLSLPSSGPSLIPSSIPTHDGKAKKKKKKKKKKKEAKGGKRT